MLSAFFRPLPRAFRTALRGGPGHLFAIAVLAGVIGLATAMFSLVYAVLLHPLPFPAQDRLKVIWKADPKAGVKLLELSYPELLDLQASVPAFQTVAAMPTTLYGYGKILQIPGRRPVPLESAPVSRDFFRTLGVHPFLGRDFSDADNHPGSAPVALLSAAVWRNDFGARRDVLGRQITLNGAGYVVIGVMPEAVDFPRGAGLWVPLGNRDDLASRGAYFLQVIGRVKPGYSDHQVNAQVNALFARLARQYPGFYSRSQQGVVTSLAEYWAGSARFQLLLSLAAALLLLLAGCATASNLFLSKAVAKTGEIATRLSLGASPRQILGHFLAEGMAAGFAAGAAGLLLASGMLRLLLVFAPPEIPRLADAHLNLPVLAFAALLTLLVAVVCSVAPALLALQVNLEQLLRESATRTAGGRRGRLLQNGFILAQGAAAAALLAASLLIVLSVHAMLTADLGFRNLTTLTMNLAPRGPGYDDLHHRLFYTQLLDRLKASPAVLAAGGVLVRPLEGAIGWDTHYRAAFNLADPRDELPIANLEVITPGYFQAVGTPLLEGRDFSPADTAAAAHTVIISRRLATRFRRAGQAPLGSRLWLGKDFAGDPRTVVGVAADARYRGVALDGDDIYLPYLQSGIPVNYLVVRGRGSSRDLLDLVKKEVAAIDPQQAVAHPATLSQLVASDTARERFNMLLLVAFGMGAVLLAVAGIYSVVKESVAVRRRELGVRLALGAQWRQMLSTVAQTTVGCLITGELAGLLLFYLLSRWFAAPLYGISADFPALLISVFLFLLALGLASAFLPVRAALRQNPAAILQG